MPSLRLCLVTDRRRLGGSIEAEETAPLVDLVKDAVAAGVDLVQIREPDLPTRVLVGVVEQARAHAAGSTTRVVVNDRVDVALAAGADGVHLKGSSVSPDAVRAIAPPAWLIGRSVHGLEEARRLERGGAVDYLVFGTVFETRSKPGRREAGLEGLAAVTGEVRLPVLAIGGMGADRAEDVARAGAAGMAVVSAFVAAHKAGELARVVGTMRRAFDRAASTPL